MTSIENTLEERGGRYGSFEHHAAIAQDLQDIMRKQAGWVRLAPDQRQALTVIADKVARMLNGDAAYRDNWHDIVGYAKLVDDRMARDELPVPMVCKAAASPESCEADLTAEPSAPPKPDGEGWRLFNSRPPRDKSAVVRALLFDGSMCEAPARELEWSLRSTGVAWWRLVL